MIRSKIRFTASAVERPVIVFRHVAKHVLLALRLVNRQPQPIPWSARSLPPRASAGSAVRATADRARRSPSGDSASARSASSAGHCVHSLAQRSRECFQTRFARILLDQPHESRCRPRRRRRSSRRLAACSGVEIPKPTASGSLVIARMDSTSGRSESDSFARSPVTPVRETR